jgi:hypothetical protein
MEELKTSELIKELRSYGLQNGGSLGRHMGIMDEAADRLEELNRRTEPENKRLKEQLAIKSEQLESLRTIFYEITGSIPSKARPRENRLTVEEIANAYLDICDGPCDGDSTTGIAPCPFWVMPDVDENNNPVQGYCKLEKYRKPEGSETP